MTEVRKQRTRVPQVEARILQHLTERHAARSARKQLGRVGVRGGQVRHFFQCHRGASTVWWYCKNLLCSRDQNSSPAQDLAAACAPARALEELQDQTKHLCLLSLDIDV